MRKYLSNKSRKKLKLNNMLKQLQASFLILVMVITLLPDYFANIVGINMEAYASTKLNNPRIISDDSMKSKQKVTWDCIWFGSYPQIEIVDASNASGCYGKTWALASDYEINKILYKALENATFDSNGNTFIGNIKYHRVDENEANYYEISNNPNYYEWRESIKYHYFRYEPIKWRVLNINNNQALLLSDIALDNLPYNEDIDNIDSLKITWETSTIRSWFNGYGSSNNLNGVNYSNKGFINNAFSNSERAAIETTNVVNDNSMSFRTDGGNDTNDKIFYLSEREVIEEKYGFSNTTFDEAKICKTSTFAKAKMATVYTERSSDWSLRSPSYDTNRIAYVNSFGHMINNRTGYVEQELPCRPALVLNLSSANIYSYAGTVCSDGTINEEGISDAEGGDQSVNDKITATYIPEKAKPSYSSEPYPMPQMSIFSSSKDLSLGDEDAEEFFPLSFNVDTCLIPVEATCKRDKTDGSLAISISIGIDDVEEMLSNPEMWKKYKSAIDEAVNANDGYAELVKNFEGNTLEPLELNKFEAKPNISFMGYGELKLDKYGNQLSSDFNIVTNCSWEGSASWQFVTSIGPIYLTAEGGGSVTGILSPKYEYTDNDWSFWDTSITVTPAVKIEAGYGIHNAATVGAYGAGEFPLQFLPWGKWDYSLEAGVHCYCLGVIEFTKELKSKHGTFCAWGSEKEKKSSLGLNPSDTNVIKLVDNKYTASSDVWYGTNTFNSTLNEKVGLSKFVIKPSIMKTSMPIVKLLGDKKIMVYQDRDNGRDAINSSKLMYSINENGVWSDPKAVWDTGTLDLYPDMDIVNGKLVLTWQKIKSVITDDVENNADSAIGNICKNSEICYAVFDNQQNSFVDIKYITNNNSFEMMPKISRDGEDTIITYVRNSTNNVLQSNGTNSILKKKLSNGTFSDETEIITNVTNIDNYISYEKNGLTQVSLISMDEKGMLCVYNNKGNNLIKLSEDGVGNVTYIDYEDGIVYFNADGLIYCYDIMTENTKTISPGKGCFGSTAKHYSNAGKEAILWQEYDASNYQGTIYSSIKVGDEYSDPIPLYKQFDQINRTLSAIIDDNGAWDIISNVEIANLRNSLVEISGLTEEKIETKLMYVDEFDVDENGNMAVNYLLTNTCEYQINKGNINIELEDGTKITESVDLNMDAGDTIWGTVYMPLGSIKKIQSADMYGSIDGQTVNDGEKYWGYVGGTDIELIKEFEEKEDSVIFTVSAVNNGIQNGETKIHLYSDSDAKHEVYTSNLINIQAGGYKTIQINIPKSFIEYNDDNLSHWMFATEVAQGDYDESNNIVYHTFITDDHTKTELRNAKEATCIEDGFTGDLYCKECNLLVSKGAMIPKTDHKWITNKIVKDATCIEEGLKLVNCSYCGESKSETLAATGHDYKLISSLKPTYTETGMNVYECSRCGITFEQSIDKLELPEIIINAPDMISKSYSTKNQAFAIGATCLDEYTLSYISNNPYVNVDPTGVVTVPAKYMGNAMITITACSKTGSDSKFKNINVSIGPTKTSISSVKNIKGKKLQIKWKKNKLASGYQIQLSEDLSFSVGLKNYTISNKKTTSKKISKLKKGKTYFVRIRPFKKTSTGKAYAEWSSAKKIVIKK